MGCDRTMGKQYSTRRSLLGALGTLAIGGLPTRSAARESSAGLYPTDIYSTRPVIGADKAVIEAREDGLAISVRDGYDTKTIARPDTIAHVAWDTYGNRLSTVEDGNLCIYENKWQSSWNKTKLTSTGSDILPGFVEESLVFARDLQPLKIPDIDATLSSWGTPDVSSASESDVKQAPMLNPIDWIIRRGWGSSTVTTVSAGSYGTIDVSFAVKEYEDLAGGERVPVLQYDLKDNTGESYRVETVVWIGPDDNWGTPDLHVAIRTSEHGTVWKRTVVNEARRFVKTVSDGLRYVHSLVGGWRRAQMVSLLIQMGTVFSLFAYSMFFGA